MSYHRNISGSWIKTSREVLFKTVLLGGLTSLSFALANRPSEAQVRTLAATNHGFLSLFNPDNENSILAHEELWKAACDSFKKGSTGEGARGDQIDLVNQVAALLLNQEERVKLDAAHVLLKRYRPYWNLDTALVMAQFYRRSIEIGQPRRVIDFVQLMVPQEAEIAVYVGEFQTTPDESRRLEIEGLFELYLSLHRRNRALKLPQNSLDLVITSIIRSELADHRKTLYDYPASELKSVYPWLLPAFLSLCDDPELGAGARERLNFFYHSETTEQWRASFKLRHFNLYSRLLAVVSAEAAPREVGESIPAGIDIAVSDLGLWEEIHSQLDHIATTNPNSRVLGMREGSTTNRSRSLMSMTRVTICNAGEFAQLLLLLRHKDLGKDAANVLLDLLKRNLVPVSVRNQVPYEAYLEAWSRGQTVPATDKVIIQIAIHLVGNSATGIAIIANTLNSKSSAAMARTHLSKIRVSGFEAGDRKILLQKLRNKLAVTTIVESKRVLERLISRLEAADSDTGTCAQRVEN